MDIRKEEIVFVQQGNAAQQLADVTLSALYGLIEHNQIAHGHPALQRPIGKKTVQSKAWYECTHLRQQVGDGPLLEQIESFFPYFLTKPSKPIHEHIGQVKKTNFLGVTVSREKPVKVQSLSL